LHSISFPTIHKSVGDLFAPQSVVYCKYADHPINICRHFISG